MSNEFKKDDRVLVTLSGIDVPAIVDYPSGSGRQAVDVVWTDDITRNAPNTVLKDRVRLDPAFIPEVKVGDVIRERDTLRNTTQSLVLVDKVDVAGVWDGRRQAVAWALPENDEASSDILSIVLPARVVAIL